MWFQDTCKQSNIICQTFEKVLLPSDRVHPQITPFRNIFEPSSKVAEKFKSQRKCGDHDFQDTCKQSNIICKIFEEVLLLSDRVHPQITPLRDIFEPSGKVVETFKSQRRCGNYDFQDTCKQSYIICQKLRSFYCLLTGCIHKLPL